MIGAAELPFGSPDMFYDDYDRYGAPLLEESDGLEYDSEYYDED